MGSLVLHGKPVAANDTVNMVVMQHINDGVQDASPHVDHAGPACFVLLIGRKTKGK